MRKYIGLLLITSLLAACQTDQTNNNNDNDEPVFEETETIYDMDDFEAIPFEDLPDEQKMVIDRRILTSEMVFYGDHEVITSTDDQTVLFDLEANDIIWEQDTGGYSVYQTIDDGLYYVTARDEVQALSVKTGKVKQKYTYNDPVKAHSVFVYDDYVVITHLEEVAVYDKETAEILWDYPIDDMITTPLELDDVFLIKVNEDEIIAFDKETGDELHTIDGQHEMYKEGFLLQDQLLFFTEDPDDLDPIYLNIYDQDSFDQIDQIEIPRTGLKPIVADHALYIMDPYRATIAIDGDLKKEIWRLDHTDQTYQFIDYTADENGLHVLVQHAEQDNSLFYLHLNAEDGSMLQYVELDGVYERDITYNFYTHDDKVYIKLVHNGKNRYYILSTDNVHTPF